MNVEITHPDKILFPKSKITKGEMVDYYKKIAKLMVPLIEDRPISMHRFPHGIKEEGFFQKNAPEYLPKWIKVKQIKRKEGGFIKMILCNDTATLVWLANQNCITPHIWLSKVDKPFFPDLMIFDLDPPSINKFHLVAQGAKLLRSILEQKLKIKSFINTTGSKGVHVVVPIKREFKFDQVKKFAHDVAKFLIDTYPEKFTMEARKNKRKGKVYIDVIRNNYGQTVVAPYSVRALEKAPIAMPISWEELDHLSSGSQTYQIKNVETRIKNRKNPWTSLHQSSHSLKQAMKKFEKLSIGSEK
ncbi:MAG: non-homologous end-joining DNA ligase [Chlamydiae bacterium]|nr:non-homologous end-joining DNA ligase [Chlamydiota bacterium]